MRFRIYELFEKVGVIRGEGEEEVGWMPLSGYVVSIVRKGFCFMSYSIDGREGWLSYRICREEQ